MDVGDLPDMSVSIQGSIAVCFSPSRGLCRRDLAYPVAFWRDLIMIRDPRISGATGD